MPTPHIAAEAGEIAPVVLMPGDPLRAAYIAEQHLEGARMVNNIRNCSGYTGTYRSVPVSVIPSGMGIPSAAIYITELYRFYDVQTIIRVGTAGVFDPAMDLRTIVVPTRCRTNSAVPAQLLGDGWQDLLTPSPDLLEVARRVADRMTLDVAEGEVFTSDIFYEPDPDLDQRMVDDGVLAVEMETAGLYALARTEDRSALSVVTTTDHLIRGEHLSAEERQSTLDEMITYALEVAAAV